MKKLFVIALATAALASCSKVEPIEPGYKSAIGFGNAFIDNATKAGELKTNNILDFAVWGTEKGMPIFDGTTEVSRADKDSDWGYTGTRYWHTNSTYKFAAIAPFEHDLTNIVLDDNKLPKTATYTLVDGGIDSQIDLLYDKADDVTVTTTLPTDPVAFTFEHMLAKVEFHFINGHNSGSGSGYTVKISDLKIAAFSSATVTFASKSWSDHTGSLNLTFPINGDAAFSEGVVRNSEPSLIIPAAADTYTITGKADIIFGGNVVKTINFNQKLPALEAGKYYLIHADITSDAPIVFSATVKDSWTSVGPNPLTQN